MSLQGRIEDLPVGDILRVVAAARRSGLLRLTGPDSVAEVLFRKGGIVGLRGAGMPASLADLLRGAVVLDAASATAAERLATERGRSVDEILGEGLVVPALAVERALETEVERRLPALLAMNAGSFEFTLGDASGALQGGLAALVLPHGLPVPRAEPSEPAPAGRTSRTPARSGDVRLLIAEGDISLPGTQAVPSESPSRRADTPSPAGGRLPAPQSPAAVPVARPGQTRPATVLHGLPPGALRQGLLGALAEAGIGARAVGSAADVKAGIEAARGRGEAIAIACHADHADVPGLEVVARAATVDTGVALVLLIDANAPLGRIAAWVDRAERLGVRVVALLPEDAGAHEAAADLARRLALLASPSAAATEPGSEEDDAGPEELARPEIPPTAERRSPARAASLARMLASAAASAEIAREILSVTAEHFERAVLFIRSGAALEALGVASSDARDHRPIALAWDHAGFLARAVVEGSPLDGVPPAADAPVLAAVGAEDARRIVVLPLSASGTCFGAVIASSRDDAADADLDLLSRFVVEVSPALWEALTREQARADVRRLRATA